jgi:hypothetical protein
MVEISLYEVLEELISDAGDIKWWIRYSITNFLIVNEKLQK